MLGQSLRVSEKYNFSGVNQVSHLFVRTNQIEVCPLSTSSPGVSRHTKAWEKSFNQFIAEIDKRGVWIRKEKSAYLINSQPITSTLSARNSQETHRTPFLNQQSQEHASSGQIQITKYVDFFAKDFVKDLPAY